MRSQIIDSGIGRAQPRFHPFLLAHPVAHLQWYSVLLYGALHSHNLGALCDQADALFNAMLQFTEPFSR